MAGTVAVRFTGDTRNLESAIGGLNGKLAGFGKAAGKAFLAVGAAAGASAIAIGVSSVKAFAEAESAQARLSDAFAKFPALADTSRASLDKLNEALARKTKFDDDATATGQAVLAQFGVTGKQLAELTPLLQDYAAKTGKDLPTAAQDLGKALLGQGRALKAVGLDLKDTGSAAGNFEALMGGLRSQVGGFAATEGQTAAGKLEILKNQFGEVQEAIGARLMPALIAVGDWLLTTGIPAFESTAATVASWWPQIVAAFETVRGVVETVVGFVSGLLDRFRSDHDNAATKVGEATSKISGFLTALRDMFMSAFEAISAIVTFAVAVLTDLWDRFGKGLVDNLQRYLGFVAEVLTGAVTVLTGIFDLIKAILTGKWGEAWEAIKQIVSGAWMVIAGYVKIGVEAVRVVIETAMGLVSAAWSAVWNGLSTLVSDIWEGIKDVVGKAVTWVLAKVDAMLGPLDEVLGKVAKIGGGVVGGVGKAIGKIPGFATGGMVPGPIGSPQLAVVHGGEQVLTPGQQRGGATAMINVSSVRPGDLIDGADLVAKLIEFQRRNGPLRIQVA